MHENGDGAWRICMDFLQDVLDNKKKKGSCTVFSFGINNGRIASVHLSS